MLLVDLAYAFIDPGSGLSLPAEEEKAPCLTPQPTTKAPKVKRQSELAVVAAIIQELICRHRFCCEWFLVVIASSPR